jgi:hypothetical protein
MGQWHARRQDQARKSRPVGAGKIDERDTGFGRGCTPGFTVVPGRNVRTPVQQRVHRRVARGCEPEHGDRFSGKGRGANHYRRI